MFADGESPISSKNSVLVSLLVDAALSYQFWTQEKGGLTMNRQEAVILQLNIGLYCNQACSHCHVESSPKRTEMMDRPTAEQCVRLMDAKADSLTTVDITGGAPEMNSQFKWVSLWTPGLVQVSAFAARSSLACQKPVCMQPSPLQSVPCTPVLIVSHRCNTHWYRHGCAIFSASSSWFAHLDHN